jgi:hypothetical protein
MTKRSAVVIAGALAQSRYGGHAWVFLQYLLGFRRLGFDVLFVDRLEPEMGIDECEADRRLRAVIEPYGLDRKYAVLCDGGARTIGLRREEVIDITKRSLVLINVMGFLNDEEILGAAKTRVFLDIDPGFAQMWRELALADVLSGHDSYLTFGANLGTPECAVPTCGYKWLATRPPVVLEHWPLAPGDRGFTSVGAWRGPFDPIEFEGTKYGLRVHELRRLAPVPQLTGRRFEAALDIDPADSADRELLNANGWVLIDPAPATGSPHAYRRFIQQSSAEFAVAKGMYVQAQTGWFSDRSACYLASGKPVLFQDTAIARHYPLGEGLLTYSNLAEAAAGVESICRDYSRHSRAARQIAEEHFDSDRVLAELLEQVAA